MIIEDFEDYDKKEKGCLATTGSLTNTVLNGRGYEQRRYTTNPLFCLSIMSQVRGSNKNARLVGWHYVELNQDQIMLVFLCFCLLLIESESCHN